MMTITQFLAIAQMLGGLIEGGKSSYASIRAMLLLAGATDAQLAELDVRMSDAIARREAERG